MRHSMHAGLAFATLLMAGCHAAPQPAAKPTLTDWAYPLAKSTGPDTPDDTKTILHLAGSTQGFTQAQTDDLLTAVDWFPDAHPPLPRPVAHGRAPDAWACGYCHLPTGDGRPENASLAGMPADYIVRQFKAFRDDSRRSAVPGRLDVMNKLAKAVTDAELDEAAAYYAKLPPHSFSHVVETATIPRVEIHGFVWAKAPGTAVEPLGNRLIEITDDWDRFELRDPRVTYTAYAPPGSIARGATLAAHWGNQGGLACAGCHGEDYRGTSIAPPLAGRSPTMMIRALNDIQHGSRHDAGVEPMQDVVKHMTPDNMIALASFMASRKP